MTSLRIILLMLFIALALHLTACAENRQPDLVFTGEANTFAQTEKRAFGGVEAIENSFVKINGELFAFFDPAATGELRKRNMRTNETKSVAKGMRFNYVIYYANVLYGYYVGAGGVWVALSHDDGETWQGNALAIPTSPSMGVVWNPSVVRDASGTWHALVEASFDGLGPNQGRVGCYYFSSADGFTWSKGVRAIDYCGNAHLVSVDGGLLAIHGDISTGIWQTTVSTFNGTRWETHLDKFLIASTGVHVCDPSAAELDDGTILLSVSVDQNSITLAEGIGTFQELFERLTK